VESTHAGREQSTQELQRLGGREAFFSGLRPPTYWQLCRSRIVKREDIAGIDELLSTMRPMDYIVTCRFHGVVFVHLMNKPVLALSSHPKVSSLMNDLGLAKYCLDIRTCDVNTMQETFLSLMANRDEIKGRMARRPPVRRRLYYIKSISYFLGERRYERRPKPLVIELAPVCNGEDFLAQMFRTDWSGILLAEEDESHGHCLHV
jgi:polysaccharide pyruvyl transferase WcaK-like protein